MAKTALNGRKQHSAVGRTVWDHHALGQAGGTGRAFDWSLWPQRSAKRLILAGGLEPDNVASAVARLAPFGVDVASGVEGQYKGRKDSERVRRFLQEARHG